MTLHEMVRLVQRRLVIWEGVDAWRVELAHVDLWESGLRATGTQLGIDPEPYRLDYRLDAGDGFVTGRLEVEVKLAQEERRLVLVRDGEGWIEGALDCDLGLSPLTNAMPVHRTGLLQRQGAEDFLMAWVSVPDLVVHASAQRYEHVRPGVVRYVDRGRFEGFTAELAFDADGLVLDYPGLACRVTAQAARYVRSQP
jgi:uncharacterized protein